MTARKAPFIPRCWLMTDARLGRNIDRIVAALPPRSAVVVRPYAMEPVGRVAMIRAIRRAARARRHLLLLAGRGSARGYDGRHGKAYRGRASGIVSRSVHNVREARLAKTLKADAVLISPLWPTQSHPQARGIGLARFRQLAQHSGGAAIALGGVNAARFRKAHRHGAHGWAAVDAWAERSEN
ncbi:MAG: thiamine phosphate synthase [Sphingopyxis sp.]